MSNKQLGAGGVIKGCADLLSHGIHEILPLVLPPAEMPVHVELPAPGSGTGTCNQEELSLLGKKVRRCSHITAGMLRDGTQERAPPGEKLPPTRGV